MKGIKSKVITDEETVRMHTNFAEFKNVEVHAASPDIATWSKQDGVLRVHTNTIYNWGIFVACRIPKSLLKAGQKYGISLVSNSRALKNINIQTGDSSHRSTEIKKSHWEGNRFTSVVTIIEANLVDGLGITSFLAANNTDYELSDFRIWEIDDVTTGGAIVSILFIMFAISLRKEVAA